MSTSSGSPSTAAWLTRCAVDSLSITPPGGAADSIRCAMPDVNADGGVAARAGIDVAGDDLTGVQSDP